MILVVSPHLDDAVLSIPAWIAARPAVTVLTVFSHGDSTHIVRRAEDHNALAILGAAPLHLGLHDAPIRRNIPQDFDHLILTPLAPDDPDAATVLATLTARIRRLDPTLLLLPLGVGEHIDHRIAHAAHPFFNNKLPIGFYADRPYATIRHACSARLARLGAHLHGAPISPSPAAARAFLAAARIAPHLRAYLPGPDREPRLQALAAPLLNPAPPSGLRLIRHDHRFLAPLRALATRAVQAHASQLPDLFASPAALLRSFAPPYHERIYWRLP